MGEYKIAKDMHVQPDTKGYFVDAGEKNLENTLN
jgi:hypothetical protein